MVEFAAAINCMDGRVQEPVAAWVREWSGARYVDMITDAGPVRVLAQSRYAQATRAMRNWLEISITAHGTTHVAVAGHADCAGNPVDEEQQRIHIRRALQTVDSWGFGVELAGLWVDAKGKVHQVE
jgi:hypothetical protein